MELILLLTIFTSFVLTLVFLPKWIRKCRQIGLLWEDMNKYKYPRDVAASGGIVVVMAFILGVLLYVGIRTFVITDTDGVTTKIFALIASISFLALVGLTDDLLGWKQGGLSKRFRLFLVLAAAVPLMVINAGFHEINVPFFGLVKLGLVYPLIVIPIGVIGATTTYNFLAGMNGLEAGQGIIILSFLSFVAYIIGIRWLSLIGLIMVASLVVFYYYNKFPAKVFPGDILTYSIGAMIAIMAILGNFEKIAVFVFIPYIIEVLLKLRGNLKIQSFGIPNKDGSLEMPEKEVYGLTHLGIKLVKVIKGKAYERDVVYLIFAFQIIICLAALIVFRTSLFA